MGVVALQRVESSGPGIQPVSPYISRQILTTAPPGKCPSLYIYIYIHCVFMYTRVCVCMLLLVSGHENAKATRTTDFDK